jgi:hypothetical protein
MCKRKLNGLSALTYDLRLCIWTFCSALILDQLHQSGTRHSFNIVGNSYWSIRVRVRDNFSSNPKCLKNIYFVPKSFAWGRPLILVVPHFTSFRDCEWKGVKSSCVGSCRWGELVEEMNCIWVDNDKLTECRYNSILKAIHVKCRLWRCFTYEFGIRPNFLALKPNSSRIVPWSYFQSILCLQQRKNNW